MSWSITAQGLPEQVEKLLLDHSNVETGDSKTEYDAALPHLIGLVKQNYDSSGRQIQVLANGHGYGGYRNCNVTIREHDPLV
jgi:hypothetical protein